MKMKKISFKIKKPHIDFKKIISNKRFRYGAYATLITVAVIAIVILFNVVLTSVEGSMGWKLDLTKNKLYSLSSQTNSILKKLDQTIYIYSLYETGKQDARIDAILSKYKTGSKWIQYTNIDPIKNPRLVEKFDKEQTGIEPGTIIVSDKDGKRFKRLGQADLFGYDYQTQTTTSIQIEPKVTGAILYITSGITPKAYFLQGHEESSVLSDKTFLKDMLNNENYEVDEINLLTAEKKLVQGDTLIIMSPKKDISKEESAKVKTFLENGGKAIFMLDAIRDDLPNFKALLQPYGLSIDKDIIVEGDQARFYQNPIYLVPSMETSDITSPLISNKLAVVMPASQSIVLPATANPAVTITPLLKTSDKAWGKINLDSQVTDKESGDLTGPFVVAVSVEKKDPKDAAKSTKIIVMGSSQFITSTDVASLSGNTDFFLNCVNWMKTEKSTNLTIRAKDIDTNKLNITDYQQAILLAVLVVIVIPLIVFGVGGIVWFRRKHL